MDTKREIEIVFAEFGHIVGNNFIRMEKDIGFILGKSSITLSIPGNRELTILINKTGSSVNNKEGGMPTASTESKTPVKRAAPKKKVASKKVAAGSKKKATKKAAPKKAAKKTATKKVIVH